MSANEDSPNIRVVITADATPYLAAMDELKRRLDNDEA